LLEGPFGAGKTTFVQGLATGLGVSTPVHSPSFVLEVAYHGGRLPLYHIDLYRLERIDDELLESLEEHVFGEGVAAIEWPAHLPPGWREGASRLEFSFADDDTRQLVIASPAERVLAAAHAFSA
jgi:tRNA threonylcarbamoyladenosine biosynthesis protein TsaE